METCCSHGDENLNCLNIYYLTVMAKELSVTTVKSVKFKHDF